MLHNALKGRIMQTFQGKRAFITGAAMGIGRAIALQLARQGCDLWLVDINGEELSHVASTARQHGVAVFARQCDLSNPDDVLRAAHEVIDRWNDLDLLINNAGVCFYGNTTSMSDDAWQKTISVNLHAPVELTRQFLPLLLSKVDRHVLNVCSMYSFLATNRCSAYHASKFGLLGFTEALRAEFGRSGLGVTALCPGFVDTEFFNNMLESEDKSARRPPSWLTTTPERVAKKALRGIRKDKRMVVVSPLAHVAYWVRRLVPGLIDSFYRIGRRQKIRAKQRSSVDSPTSTLPFPTQHVSDQAESAAFDDSSRELPSERRAA
jgi:short-subunit dehydrogenase